MRGTGLTSLSGIAGVVVSVILLALGVVVLAAADLQFSHIFRCVELTSDDGQGYNQISIRPLHGDNLLERLRMAELEVSIES